MHQAVFTLALAWIALAAPVGSRLEHAGQCTYPSCVVVYDVYYQDGAWTYESQQALANPRNTVPNVPGRAYYTTLTQAGAEALVAGMESSHCRPIRGHRISCGNR
jgi:hypothetical protein